MVKTSLGIPTTAGEFKELIKDAFASEFKVGEYFDEFNPTNNAVIIPTYIFGEESLESVLFADQI